MSEYRVTIEGINFTSVLKDPPDRPGECERMIKHILARWPGQAEFSNAAIHAIMGEADVLEINFILPKGWDGVIALRWMADYVGDFIRESNR